MQNSILILGICLLLVLTMGLTASADEPRNDSTLRAVAHAKGLEGRVMWMDATANLKTLMTREGVRDIVAKCKKANITTIVLDVKPLVGEVLYNSTVAPKMKKWKDTEYPASYDLLQTMIEEAHAVGIPVIASMNVFAEGHRDLGIGPGYGKRDWQSMVYNADRFAVAASGARFALAQNPNETPTAKAIMVLTQMPKAPKQGEIYVTLCDGKVTAVTEGDAITANAPALPEGALLLAGIGESRDWLLQNAPVDVSIKMEAIPYIKSIADVNVGGWAVFVNPANPQVRAYELSQVRDILERYDVDGIALDRMRYANIYTDFSDLSRAKFERWMGKPVENWPQDIYVQSSIPGGAVIPGKYYKEWIEWRAWNIHEFLADVEAARRVIRPKAKVCAYVGSWYDSYYNEGVNWASESFNAGLDWMTPSYHTTGYADLLDCLMVGSYYKKATREEAIQAGTSPGATVQGATEGSVRVVNDATWVYGGLYLLDYKDNPDAFERAVRAAINAGEGVMLFDLVYVVDYNWWPVLDRIFATPTTAPHDVPGLRDTLRKANEQIRQGADSSIKDGQPGEMH